MVGDLALVWIGSDWSHGQRRLSLLASAARYAAGHSELKPDDVLAIAIQWDRWVVDGSA